MLHAVKLFIALIRTADPDVLDERTSRQKRSASGRRWPNNRIPYAFSEGEFSKKSYLYSLTPHVQNPGIRNPQ